ncbi:MAG: hypothetical protein DWQ44_01565 [Bacteroidetes bacterium]|nr:MAG: hypothetical protein DWQ33_05295 [Bacteroidota bacterium]REK04666.1 MAG: hypothetical protein DWQ39_05455 [Bacteroidota bacterium]REK36141.1 MAG: hypothetical protein DWQ44_01565 [Bacteroidota bacterium]REK51488.1 MAG: hypothetical protein DWQ48_01270 [Bacteroidota bacterium]
MSAIELQDHIHVYSMFSFKSGRKEAGIIFNKYNIHLSEIEYFFIPHFNMQAYKSAFERYDRHACIELSEKIDIQDIISIRPVSLADYKIILELLNERNQIINSMH